MLKKIFKYTLCNQGNLRGLYGSSKILLRPFFDLFFLLQYGVTQHPLLYQWLRTWAPIGCWLHTIMLQAFGAHVSVRVFQMAKWSRLWQRLSNMFGVTDFSDAEMRLWAEDLSSKHASQNSCCKAFEIVNQTHRVNHANMKSADCRWKQLQGQTNFGLRTRVGEVKSIRWQITPRRFLDCRIFL